MRKFKIIIRIGRTTYTRERQALTENLATLEAMADLWDATGTDPEKMKLISSAEVK